ncbi:hypothetical protein ACFL4S_02030, partial [bacterium]
MFKINRIIILIFIFTFMFLGCAVLGPNSIMEKSYQADMDQIRIRDVHYIASLVEKYYNIKGYYPFGDGIHPLPVNASLTNSKKYMRPGFIMKAEFDKELKLVLGEETIIPKDPQKIHPYGPRLYQYYTDGENYTVSAYLFES